MFSSEFLSRTLPSVLATAMVAAVLVLGTLHFSGAMSRNALAQVNFVTFDVIKFGNAQRAIAATFLGKEKDNLEAAGVLANVSKRSRDVISEVAGPGTVVLVKQASLTPGVRDITDDVLKALGLPTDVPTADPGAYAMDIAPTWLRMTPLEEAKREERSRFADALRAEERGTNPLIP